MSRSNAKASQIISTKNIGVLEILAFEIFKEALTNNIVNFEQLGPEIYDQEGDNINFSHGETPSKEQTTAFIQLCARFINQKPLEIIGKVDCG